MDANFQFKFKPEVHHLFTMISQKCVYTIIKYNLFITSHLKARCQYVVKVAYEKGKKNYSFHLILSRQTVTEAVGIFITVNRNFFSIYNTLIVATAKANQHDQVSSGIFFLEFTCSFSDKCCIKYCISSLLNRIQYV